MTDFGQLQVKHRDIAEATRYGNHISAAAKTFLRLESIRIAIVDAALPGYRWGGTSAEGLPTYPWHFVKGDRYLAKYPPNEILPHEIGHDLLRLYFIKNTASKQYGTDAPDWLDEAVAVSFELPPDKVQRRCQARALLEAESLLPLRRYLRMEHPSLSSINAQTTRPDKIVYKNTAPKDTPAFYSMSLAFPEYVADVIADEGVLADFIEAHLEKASLDRFAMSLVQRSRRIQTMEDLELDFHSWVRQHGDYKCGR